MTFAELYNALLRCADDIIGCKMKLVIMTKKSFDILSPENVFSKETGQGHDHWRDHLRMRFGLCVLVTNLRFGIFDRKLKMPM